MLFKKSGQGRPHLDIHVKQRLKRSEGASHMWSGLACPRKSEDTSGPGVVRGEGGWRGREKSKLFNLHVMNFHVLEMQVIIPGFKACYKAQVISII